jgi:hypothetical protein
VTDEIWRYETRLAIRLGTAGACDRGYRDAARILHAALRPDSRGGSGVPATDESIKAAYDDAVTHQDQFFEGARGVLEVAGRSRSAPSQWKLDRSPEA